MHLIDQNSFLEELDLHPDQVSHPDPDYEALEDDEFQDSSTGVTDSSADEDDLDDWSEGLYLCRWPNGEFSAVPQMSECRQE